MALSADRARVLMFAGLASSGLGVVVAATALPSIGGAFVVAGWMGAVWGLHAFGRRGASDAQELRR